MKLQLLNYKISAQAVLKVLAIPPYFFISLVSGFIILGLSVWLFSFQTLAYVLAVPFLSLSDKFDYFFSPYGNSFLYFFRDPIVFTRDLFVIIAAVNVTLFIFIRRRTATAKSLDRKGTSGAIIGIVASGCVACGTSIVAPVFASLGATASASSTQIVGITGNIVGILLLIYSLYGLGRRAARELP